MNLSRLNAAVTRWIFRAFLLRNAYTREALEGMAAASRFGRCVISEQGIGFELRIFKSAAWAARLAPSASPRRGAPGRSPLEGRTRPLPGREAPS